MKRIPPKRTMKQQTLKYPAQKYVITTHDEQETIGRGMAAVWAQMDTLAEAFMTPHAVDHQEVQAALSRLQVEIAVINSAIMSAKRSGWYVSNPSDATAPATHHPSEDPRDQPPTDGPPF